MPSKSYLYLFSFSLLAVGCQKSAPKLYTVEIKQMKFQPAELHLNKGDTVLWVNRDILPHNVTEESGKTWSSPPIPSGGSWRLVTQKNAGYYCNIHPVMKGKLLIK